MMSFSVHLRLFVVSKHEIVLSSSLINLELYFSVKSFGDKMIYINQEDNMLAGFSDGDFLLK